MNSSGAPGSLVKYEPSVEIYETMKAYHQEKAKNENNSSSPPKIEGSFEGIQKLSILFCLLEIGLTIITNCTFSMCLISLRRGRMCWSWLRGWTWC